MCCDVYIVISIAHEIQVIQDCFVFEDGPPLPIVFIPLRYLPSVLFCSSGEKKK